MLGRGHRNELARVVLHGDLVSEIKERYLNVVLGDDIARTKVLELGSWAAYHDHFRVQKEHVRCAAS